MKKKLIAIILCLLSIAALVGCDNTPDNTSDNQGNIPEGKIVLKWMPAYLDPEVVNKYVNEFNATHENIQVVASDATYGSVAEYTSSLAMSIAGDNSYDLFSMSAADFNKYITSGVAYCLDDHLKNNADIKSYALDLVTRDGHVYGYPATNDTIGVYVNLDMLAASGHTVEDLQTWDGMVAAAIDIAKTQGNYGCLTHLGFGGGYAEFLWYASMWSAGGDISMDLDGNITVTNKDALTEAALDWKQLVRGEGGSTEFNNEMDYFYNGMCGMLISGQTALSEIDEYLSGGYSFEWDFIPIPAANETAEHYSPFGGWFTVVNARNAYAQQAAEFMDWLYFETDYVADMCRAYYQISPIYSADEKLADLYGTHLGKVLNYINNGQMVCKAEIALNSDALEELGKMLSRVIYQSTDKSEAQAYVDRFLESVNATVKN